MNKPITPQVHGIIDYAFAGLLCGMPAAIGLNGFCRKTYCAVGSNFLGVNSLTDTPVGIKPVFSMKSHQKLDAVTLAGLAALTLAKPIRNDKKALSFHLGFLGIAVAHYLLTDYDG